ncbi:hypothetical protein [Psychrobacillus sp.]|uniref:hypothetical protein n=1 Tax=Psychrobacillus sp. TaxID=1871623 RepID=UPI0028BEBAD3|nr:hypothetical protein [Psychrobacillus sp.]
MNIFEGVEIDYMYIIGPLLVLMATMFTVTLIYSLLFKWLPKSLFNFLIGPVALFGAYLWAFPMNFGFYEFFK